MYWTICQNNYKKEIIGFPGDFHYIEGESAFFGEC